MSSLGISRTHRSTERSEGGFTLLETMIVVAIMGILAATAVISYEREQKKVRRTEIVLGLDKIREAQDIYYMEFGDYADNFDDLLFATSSGKQISSTAYQGGVYQYTISQPWGRDSYYVSATGNIDGDAFLDVWVLEAGRFN